MERLRELTRRLLEVDRPAFTLRPEVLELAAILAESQETFRGQQGDIATGELRTSHGLALSPVMAAMCANDFVRTIEFIRGAHAAVVDLKRQFPDRPVRVLYAGCGPYATLALPLMTVLSSTEATFTLLDVHPESITSARSIVTSLGLAGSVESFQALDAASYRVQPDQPPDVILLEIMQACLESEPQVAVTRHLLRQAPDALVIPEEVSIDLKMVDLSREFDLDELAPSNGAISRDRITVGTVFVVNRASIHAWDGDFDDRLPASTVRIPDDLEQRYQPMLFTIIRVYKNHILQDYDSGLTCPRTPTLTGSIKPGGKIQFHYQLGSHPRLVGESVV